MAGDFLWKADVSIRILEVAALPMPSRIDESVRSNTLGYELLRFIGIIVVKRILDREIFLLRCPCF